MFLIQILFSCALDSSLERIMNSRPARFAAKFAIYSYLIVSYSPYSTILYYIQYNIIL